MPVKFEVRGGYAIVTLDNPPVNAIGQAERQGLLDACEAIAAAASIHAVVVVGEGRFFAAGADTREFDGPALTPHLPNIVSAIEASDVPWIAAINGVALGGGLEIALGCHKRIGSIDCSVGLPEVTLGVVPGAGGTQRLPRLLGFGPAISMISEGKVIKADEALRAGLLDEVADDPLERAIALAKSFTAPTSRLSDRPRPQIDTAALASAKARAGRRARGQIAPMRAIELVELSTRTNFAEGAAKEREAFLELRQSEQAKALRHVFFAERGARAPAAIAKIEPIKLHRCVVVGGGTMGAGIAYAFAQIGVEVCLIETDVSSKARAEANVAKIFADGVKRRLLNVDQAGERSRRVKFQIGYNDLVADLAIEAAFEDMSVKRNIFSELDGAMPAHAVLATNTSYLDVNEIAAVTKRPESVLGLHFFSPPHVMKLLEIVKSKCVSNIALATAFDVAARLRKIPVVSGVCDGFIGNRILRRYREAADMILLSGGLPWEIDAAMVDFGYAMGPYEAQDMAGLDIAFLARKRKSATPYLSRRYGAIGDRMVEAGRLGRKAGVGWYQYPDGGGAVIDPLVEDLITEESHLAKITRRTFTKEEIRSRLLAAMIAESEAILDEGIAAHPRDIDLVTIHGYGFPRWRGGLMHFAQAYGHNLAADIERFKIEDPAI